MELTIESPKLDDVHAFVELGCNGADAVEFGFTSSDRSKLEDRKLEHSSSLEQLADVHLSLITLTGDLELWHQLDHIGAVTTPLNDADRCQALHCFTD